MNAALFEMGIAIDTIVSMENILMAIVIGMICGPLGAIMLTCITYLNMLRAHFIKEKWQKFLEIMLLAVLTSTCFFFAPYYMNSECVPNITEPIYEGMGNITVRYNCPEDYYSPLATMLLNTETSIVKTIVYGEYKS